LITLARQIPRWARAGALALALAAGCGAGHRDEAGSSSSALTNPNSLNLNALNLNALNLNALNLNALNLNALNLNSLDPAALSTLSGSTLTSAIAREVFRYMVGCALGPSHSVEVTWTDSKGRLHVETYYGLLSLATSWTGRALTGDEADWVSACVVSRANYYGTAVEISSRGNHSQLSAKTTSAERAAFTRLEGAFWGNLFGSAPYLRACHFAPNLSYSRTKYRDCAVGHLKPNGTIESCGPIARHGTCLDESGNGQSWTPCKSLNSGDYYQACLRPDGSESDRVVTTWLQ